MVLVAVSREETHVAQSADLQEDSREVVEHRLKKLQAKRARHLRHAHQPVGRISVDQLTQVLLGGKKRGSEKCGSYTESSDLKSFTAQS